MEIPSIALYTAKRFGILSLWIAGGIAVGWLFPHVLSWSNDYLGSPFYALVTIIVAVMLYFSYQIAKIDVEQDERRRERVLSSLKSDH